MCGSILKDRRQVYIIKIESCAKQTLKNYLNLYLGSLEFLDYRYFPFFLKCSQFFKLFTSQKFSKFFKTKKSFNRQNLSEHGKSHHKMPCWSLIRSTRNCGEKLREKELFSTFETWRSLAYFHQQRWHYIPTSLRFMLKNVRKLKKNFF